MQLLDNPDWKISTISVLKKLKGNVENLHRDKEIIKSNKIED